MAPAAVSPVHVALCHLETAERDLTQLLADNVKAGDVIRRDLDATRGAIAGLRSLQAPSGAPPPSSSAALSAHGGAGA